MTLMTWQGHAPRVPTLGHWVSTGLGLGDPGFVSRLCPNSYGDFQEATSSEPVRKFNGTYLATSQGCSAITNLLMCMNLHVNCKALYKQRHYSYCYLSSPLRIKYSSNLFGIIKQAQSNHCFITLLLCSQRPAQTPQ